MSTELSEKQKQQVYIDSVVPDPKTGQRKIVGQYWEGGLQFPKGCAFEPCCTFGPGCRFDRSCTFGSNCMFNPGCVFYAGCSFDSYCKFGSNSNFSNGCTFGPFCRLGPACTFGRNCKFSSDCKFGYNCKFCLGCEFDAYCRFGHNCMFHGHPFTDVITLTGAGSEGRFVLVLNTPNGVMVEAGCFFGTGEEFVKKATEDDEKKGRVYGKLVELAQLQWG